MGNWGHINLLKLSYLNWIVPPRATSIEFICLCPVTEIIQTLEFSPSPRNRTVCRLSAPWLSAHHLPSPLLIQHFPMCVCAYSYTHTPQTVTTHISPSPHTQTAMSPTPPYTHPLYPHISTHSPHICPHAYTLTLLPPTHTHILRKLSGEILLRSGLPGQKQSSGVSPKIVTS